MDIANGTPGALDAESLAARLRELTGLPAGRIRHDGTRLILDPDTVSEFLPTLIGILAALALLAATLLLLAGARLAAAPALLLALLLLAARFLALGNVSEYDLLDRAAGVWRRGRELGGRRTETERFPFARLVGLAVRATSRPRDGEESADGAPAETFASPYSIYARLDDGTDILLMDVNLADFDRSRAAAETLAAWIGKPLLDG